MRQRALPTPEVGGAAARRETRAAPVALGCGHPCEGRGWRRGAADGVEEHVLRGVRAQRRAGQPTRPHLGPAAEHDAPHARRLARRQGATRGKEGAHSVAAAAEALGGRGAAAGRRGGPCVHWRAPPAQRRPRAPPSLRRSPPPSSPTPCTRGAAPRPERPRARPRAGSSAAAARRAPASSPPRAPWAASPPSAARRAASSRGSSCARCHPSKPRADALRAWPWRRQRGVRRDRSLTRPMAGGLGGGCGLRRTGSSRRPTGPQKRAAAARPPLAAPARPSRGRAAA